MNQKTAKATRREIRRAVGVHGLHAVNDTTRRVIQLSADVERDGGRLNQLEAAVAALNASPVLPSLSLRQRVRWLLTGAL